MATNERELVAAKDLPVTEAEEVDVLVVDPATGELCKKSGANLGGGGGGAQQTSALIYNYITDESPSVDELIECIKRHGRMIVYTGTSTNVYASDVLSYQVSSHDEYGDSIYIKFVDNSGNLVTKQIASRGYGTLVPQILEAWGMTN